jgi:hypothetical protein
MLKGESRKRKDSVKGLSSAWKITPAPPFQSGERLGLLPGQPKIRTTASQVEKEGTKLQSPPLEKGDVGGF